MFTPLEEIPNNEKLLNECGITHLGLEFCPTIDFNEVGEPYVCGTNAFAFIGRYNGKKISLHFNSYIKNKEIQSCLCDLELDPERFWYLLLFVSDYCAGACLDIIKTEEGAGKQIEKFIDLIWKEGNDSYREPEQTIKTLENITFNEPAELMLRIGKKKLSITNSKAIGMIGMMCGLYYPEIKDASVFMDRIIAGEVDEYSDAAMAYLFCKMLRCFFDSTHIKERRATGANISNKEKELLSYLLHFTKISRNVNLLNPLTNDYNTVKGLMNPKKIPEFKGFNNYY